MSGLRLWIALMAAVQFIAASSALPDLLPAAVAQWIQLTDGALMAATSALIGRATTTR